MIRQLAASFNGNLLAAAEFETKVHLWDLITETKISELTTILDFGGQRLSISPDSQFLAVASYNRSSLTLHNTNTGRLLWIRKDLKKIQIVNFGFDNDTIYVSSDDNPLVVLDRHTGETLTKLKNATNIWLNPYGNLFLLETGKFEFNDGSKKVFEIGKKSFATLDVCFDKEFCYITESSSQLRAISLKTASVLWTVQPKPGMHFLKLGYNDYNQLLFGILWNYEIGGSKVVCIIDRLTGTVINQLILNQGVEEVVFAKKGSLLICSNGDIFNLNDASLIYQGKLSFD